MRRKDREVTDIAQIEAIIKENKVCRLGFNDDGEVYIVPMNYGYVQREGKRIFYFHCAREGRKHDLMQKSPRVAFEIDSSFAVMEGPTACSYSAQYQSIMGNGILTEVTEPKEKEEGLTILMNSVAGKADWTFEQEKLDAIKVLKLELNELTCKVH